MEEALVKPSAKPFPHEQTKRYRGITDEEEVSYPETLIGTASTAVRLGNGPRGHRRCSWPPVGAHQVETKVKPLCAKQQMHSDSLKHCQVGIKGILLRCSDPISRGKGTAAGL